MGSIADVKAFHLMAQNALATIFLRAAVDLVPLELPHMLLLRLWSYVFTASPEVPHSQENHDVDGGNAEGGGANTPAPAQQRLMKGWNQLSTSMLQAWAGSFSVQSINAFVDALKYAPLQRAEIKSQDFKLVVSKTLRRHQVCPYQVSLPCPAPAAEPPNTGARESCPYQTPRRDILPEPVCRRDLHYMARMLKALEGHPTLVSLSLVDIFSGSQCGDARMSTLIRDLVVNPKGTVQALSIRNTNKGGHGLSAACCHIFASMLGKEDGASIEGTKAGSEPKEELAAQADGGARCKRSKLTHLKLDSILLSGLNRELRGPEAVQRLLVTILWDMQLKAISLAGSEGLPPSCAQPLLALASLRPRCFRLRELIRLQSGTTTISRKELFMRSCCKTYLRPIGGIGAELKYDGTLPLLLSTPSLFAHSAQLSHEEFLSSSFSTSS
jgi:hypothetical protein